MRRVYSGIDCGAVAGASVGGGTMCVSVPSTRVRDLHLLHWGVSERNKLLAHVTLCFSQPACFALSYYHTKKIAFF